MLKVKLQRLRSIKFGFSVAWSFRSKIEAGQYAPSAVGEVNVVTKMKETNAVIGGEGNGGVIIPELHYGRDALIGIALFLSHLAKKGKTMKNLRGTYPDYFISKNKIELNNDVNVKQIFERIKSKYKKKKKSY